MYKSAVRLAPRRILRPQAVNSSSRRLLSTAPPAQKRRSWKNAAARWGLAVGGIYYYNTNTLFADEPEEAIQRLNDSVHAVQESEQPTIDAIVEEKRKRYAQKIAENKSAVKKDPLANAGLTLEERANWEKDRPELVERIGEEAVIKFEEDFANQSPLVPDAEGAEEVGADAGQEGAFNPETGEINWDCPCLGGMAHGPCGDEFKAAFSCFVYSDQEPKGMECIDKFKGMQDCFRLHPEIYASELEDEEDEIDDELSSEGLANAADKATNSNEASPVPAKVAEPSSAKVVEKVTEKEAEKVPASSPARTVDPSESIFQEVDAVPKAAHDATSK